MDFVWPIYSGSESWGPIDLCSLRKVNGVRSTDIRDGNRPASSKDLLWREVVFQDSYRLDFVLVDRRVHENSVDRGYSGTTLPTASVESERGSLFPIEENGLPGHSQVPCVYLFLRLPIFFGWFTGKPSKKMLKSVRRP